MSGCEVCRGPRVGLGARVGISRPYRALCLRFTLCMVAVTCCFTDYAGAEAVGPPQAAAGVRLSQPMYNAMHSALGQQGSCTCICRLCVLLVNIYAVHGCQSLLPIACARFRCLIGRVLSSVSLLAWATCYQHTQYGCVGALVCRTPP